MVAWTARRPRINNHGPGRNVRAIFVGMDQEKKSCVGKEETRRLEPRSGGLLKVVNGFSLWLVPGELLAGDRLVKRTHLGAEIGPTW